MQRDDQGKFVLKNGEHRSVRSLRLTDTTWWRIGTAAESLSLTKADLLEQMFRSNDLELPLEKGAGFVANREESDTTAGDVIKPAPLSWQDSNHFQPSNTPRSEELLPRNTPKEEAAQPSNTRKNEEIQRLRAEVAHLREENAFLVERVRQFPQVKDLEAFRDRVLKSLRLGKQAPGYKTAKLALDRFIELSRSDSKI